MNIFKQVCISVAATAPLVFGQGAFAEPYSNVIIFSGSLSDTGNFGAVNGDLPYPFYQNRTTNGPNSVEVFANYFGFGAAPSLHLLGQNAGNNYSVIASRAGGTDPIDLPAQLDAHLNARGGAADPNALYLVFIGGHEVREAIFEPDDEKAYKILDDTVEGMAVAIKRLVNAGAKTIYAPNFIDYAVTPEARLANVIDRSHFMSVRFNTRFEKMLDRLECSLRIDIARWNFEAFVNNVLGQADKLGFTNSTEACTSYLASGQCDFDKFIFLNEVFPTAKVHSLIGQALALSFVDRKPSPSGRVCKKLKRARFALKECRSDDCEQSAGEEVQTLIKKLRR